MINSNDVEIGPGSRVRIRYADGHEESALIRGNDQKPWGAGSIAGDSPLARALMGKRAGDEVEFQVQTVAPVRKLTILSVDALCTEAS